MPGLTPALASDSYDLAPLIWVVFIACVLLAAIVGRFWTLLLPVALILGVLVLGLSDRFYSSVSEDTQIAVFFGGVLGLLISAPVLFGRHLLMLQRRKRRRAERRRDQVGTAADA